MPPTVPALQDSVDLEIWPPLMLAPMSGVTNRTMRALYKPFGLGLTVTEFVSSNALKYGSRRTMEMIDQHGVEKPVSTQLWGDDPATMARGREGRARMRRRRRGHQLRLPGAESDQDQRRLGVLARSRIAAKRSCAPSSPPSTAP